MTIFSYHLARVSTGTALRAMMCPPKAVAVDGLLHAECMTSMILGSGVLSLGRMQLKNLAMFARWESASAIDDFLLETEFGCVLAEGWHVRLAFLRRWGQVDALADLPECQDEVDMATPVVAVTLARMKLLQVPRFIRWGKPVERFVRDHSGTTLATASIRFPRTVSTFSIWKSQAEMLDMVWGNDAAGDPERHVVAMRERDRKDFHREFTTLRFQALAEHGSFDGRSDYVPGLGT